MKKRFLMLFSICHMGAAIAETATWVPTGGSTWRTNANWNTNIYPQTTDDVAILGSAITAPATITNSALTTVGSISFNNTNSYSITGSAFNMSVTSGSAGLTVTTGAHSMATGLTLNNNLIINQASSGTFTLSGAVSGAFSITKSGSGIIDMTGVTGPSVFSGGLILQAGTILFSSADNLGSATSPLTISGGTLQAAAGVTLPSTRNITLSGNATFDTSAYNLIIQGTISSSGTIAVNSTGGGGILTLAPASGTNTFTGNITVGTGATLQIGSDAYLGVLANTVSLNAGTLAVTNTFTSARAVILTGSSSIDTAANTLTLSGVVSGAGGITKIGSGTLILTGTNTYMGANTITAGTLQGNTASIIGNIANNGTAVIFDQSANGTYSGALTGAGDFRKQNSGTLTLTGNNSAFTGVIAVQAGTLQVNSSLATAGLATISSGATLIGNNIIGPVDNSGTLANQDATSTLTITGNLTSHPTSVTSVSLNAGGSGLIKVTGSAGIDGTLAAHIANGFYGLNSSHTILTGAPVTGTFSTLVIDTANFTAFLSYPGNSVVLNLTTIQPFFDFSYSNSNTKSVGNNINALALAGTLSSDTDLVNVIDTFTNESSSAINEALDQMHPAQISALGELQFELGGQLLSMFHHRPNLLCSCENPGRIWAEPFGNWLHRKHQGEEISFHATTKGIAFGLDAAVIDGWVIGAGGAWSDTNLRWSNHRGHSTIHGLYGSFYSDYSIGNFYIGTSAYGGGDWIETDRKIEFTTVHRNANAKFHGLELGGQLTSAYYFGTPVGFLYPYGTVDYLYLRTRDFQESGANSLDLHVNQNRSGTIRAEAGIAFQTNDKNKNETICISPLVAFGWVLERPIMREDYVSTFANQTISFKVQGWQKTQQLLNVKFGLGITYKCFTLDSEYFLDLSTDAGFPYCNQRANFRLNANF